MTGGGAARTIAPAMHTPAPVLSLRDYTPSRGSHAHDHFQVLLGLDGVLEIEVEGRGSGIGTGQAQVVAPGDRHDFEARRGGSVCLVLDTPHAPWARCVEQPPADAPRLHALARYLAHCLQQPQHAALALQHGPALLLEAWGAVAPSVADTRRRRIDWPALAAWAQTNWHRPLGVADLAEVACLSPSQFAQLPRGAGPERDALAAHTAAGPCARTAARRPERGRDGAPHGLPVAVGAHGRPAPLTPSLRDDAPSGRDERGA